MNDCENLNLRNICTAKSVLGENFIYLYNVAIHKNQTIHNSEKVMI